MSDIDDFDGYEVEDLLKKGRKKGTDGGRKGKRTERNLVKILTDRFGAGFSRSLGSGNRWGQVSHLPKHAKETLTGDLCCPPGFKWVLESKGGYNDIDLNGVFHHGSTQLNSFIDQVTNDSQRCGRKPMLLWKRDFKPWLAFVRTPDLNDREFKYMLKYGEWTAVLLDHLLELGDDFFFEGNNVTTT